MILRGGETQRILEGEHGGRGERLCTDL
jgi:hypothetical protein